MRKRRSGERVLKRIPFAVIALSPLALVAALFLGCLLCEEEPAKADKPKPQVDSAYRITQVVPAAIQISPNQKEQKGTTSKSGCQRFCGWLDHAIGDPVAAFTALLAYMVFLQLLWMNRQEKVLSESVGVAKKAADAAKESADAAVKSVMPIIIPLVKHSWQLLPQDRSSSTPHRPAYSFVLENHGKSPAMLVKLVYQLWIGRGEPPTLPPWREGEYKCRTDWEVVPGETRLNPMVATIPAKFHRDITGEEIAELASDPTPENPDPLRFFFFGYVIYDDVFGYQHVKGFGRKVFPSTSNEIARQATRGGSTYEYYRRINRRDDYPD